MRARPPSASLGGMAVWTPLRSDRTSADRSEPRPPEEKAPPIGSRARAISRIAFAILLGLLALWVASDFLPALTWAAVIAITTWPISCGQKIGTAGRTCSLGGLPKRLTGDNGVASVFRDLPIAAAESGLWMKPWACDQASS